MLTDYFSHEPVYSAYDTDNSTSYRRVASAIDQWGTVKGHLVQSNLMATNDHLLVDKEDFNCPISYQFASGKRMWYQRMPDLYVDLTKGWETVSLPFTAELVTTQQKGEITHFYSGSHTIPGSDAKIGHEYWLREYGGISGSDAGVLTATFNHPTASGDDKQVDNTFLWDYYYSKNDQEDAYTDIYQTYYQTSREYTAYPLLTTAKPYIIGFPGRTFYEFDLSGEWLPQNTAAPAPEQLEKQAISFVSETGITIGVSDDELKNAVTEDNYGFKPNYMSKKVEGYLMNTDGNSFDVTPDGGLVTVPFRPYFIAAPSQGAREVIRSIVFNMDSTGFDFGDDEKRPIEDELGEGTLEIYTLGQDIAVTSTLRKAVPVRIYSAAGALIAMFDIQPDETIKTPVYSQGVYIVRADGGKYTKKLGVK